MSAPLGFGLGDAVLVIRGAWWVARQLTGEAVNDFKECSRVCRRFVALMELYEPLLAAFPSDDVRKLRRDVRRMLRRFVAVIEHDRNLLGSQRPRWSPRTALRKLDWPRKARTLDKLRRELESRIQLINFHVTVVHL